MVIPEQARRGSDHEVVETPGRLDAFARGDLTAAGAVPAGLLDALAQVPDPRIRAGCGDLACLDHGSGRDQPRRGCAGPPRGPGKDC